MAEAKRPTMIAAVDQDLICAIATPPGGGIGVVRLSGPGAKELRNPVRFPMQPRKAVYCEFTHQNERLDDGIALWFHSLILSQVKRSLSFRTWRTGGSTAFTDGAMRSCAPGQTRRVQRTGIP